MRKFDWKKIAIVVIWIAMVTFLYKAGLITTDASKIRRILLEHQHKATIIFMLISVARIIVFIPSAVLIVLGGTIFGPVKGFVLSMIAMIISESIVFFIGKYYVGEKANGYLYRKHGDIMRLMEKYRDKFLVVGMLCPVAPLDVICFISSIFGYSYRKFVTILIATHIPFVTLCSLLGESYEKSAINKIVIISLLLVLVFYTYKTWSTFKKELKEA
ncbi:TVP38/TMEM64 family protein [Clostridium cellulovorans]|uniref:TVP38/TMEM64 family membrane protein n=1 Tax=Clostridium cellulovorans (strain ATCC 35296 / DSM 3052 / OCM 3 / 743B) TaxID=573061 RepID=D9SR83_CLOC7|nr:VTT domain-containing protein [Clostridium cellulovorans]ADL50371.1 SNARE associated Golgi protein [Clostridium cellulovorans 743B]